MRNFKDFSEWEKSALRFFDQVMRDMQQRPGAYTHACFSRDDLEGMIEAAHRGLRYDVPQRQIALDEQRFAAGIQEANERAEQILAIEEAKKPFKSTVRFERLYKRIEKASTKEDDGYYTSLMDAASCSVTDEQWDEICRRLDAFWAERRVKAAS